MNMQALSKHRHISFTAHYTGYVWYQMGISHPIFATELGKSLATMLEPVELGHEWMWGNSVRKTMQIRHSIIDTCLHHAIQENPAVQVLEIAAGLSPRGWHFRQHYPQLNYRELDLPEMAATKTALLKQIAADSPDVLAVDVFAPEFEALAELFDTTQPLVVVSEGLINYFDREVLVQLLAQLVTLGQHFPSCQYLTDVYPQPLHTPLAWFFWSSSQVLKLVSHSDFGFHFSHPDEVVSCFEQHGFATTQVILPSKFYQHHPLPPQCGSIPQDDLVWVVKAQQQTT